MVSTTFCGSYWPSTGLAATGQHDVLTLLCAENRCSHREVKRGFVCSSRYRWALPSLLHCSLEPWQWPKCLVPGGQADSTILRDELRVTKRWVAAKIRGKSTLREYIERIHSQNTQPSLRLINCERANCVCT